jgi:hypothetical protein
LTDCIPAERQGCHGSGGCELIGKYKDVPFAKNIAFDVNQYVTEKTTDDLFFVVGQEEKKIRTNPSARVTDLLKEVFSKK